MKKTKFIGIAAAALVMAAGVTPNFSSGFFSSGNTLTVKADYIPSGEYGGKFTYYIDNDTYLYLKVTDANNRKAAVVGSGLQKADTSVRIPESAIFQDIEYTVTEIAAGAFEGQTNLVYVSGMKNVTSIGDRAFYNCTSLKYVSADAINRSGKNQLSVIGNEAFANCSSLSSVSSNNVSAIGNNAFSRCESLESIFMQNLSSLGTGAFEYCNYLSEINLDGAPLKTIPSNAFSDCSRIQNIVLPETLEVIGESAFNNCRYMETIYIPDSVKRIEPYAFSYCRYMSTVMLPEKIEYIGDYAFYGCDRMKYFVCKNPGAGIGYQAVGYDHNKFYTGKKNTFVIWGKGGNIKNYASEYGFTYRDCSEAPAIAKQKMKDCQWTAVNTKANWADPSTGKHFFLDRHKKYVPESLQNEQFSTSGYGLAVVSAMAYSGILSVDNICPGYSNVRSVPSGSKMPSLTKSYVNTVWSMYSPYTYDCSGVNNKKLLRYAEYITYGADAAVCMASPSYSGTTSALVCYGLEFKEDADDRNTNRQWSNMDARILVYDVNETSTAMTKCYYVNFTTGNWGSDQLLQYHNGQADFLGFRYSPSRNPGYEFKMTYTPKKIVSYYDGMQDISGYNLLVDLYW